MMNLGPTTAWQSAWHDELAAKPSTSQHTCPSSPPLNKVDIDQKTAVVAAVGVVVSAGVVVVVPGAVDALLPASMGRLVRLLRQRLGLVTLARILILIQMRRLIRAIAQARNQVEAEGR